MHLRGDWQMIQMSCLKIRDNRQSMRCQMHRCLMETIPWSKVLQCFVPSLVRTNLVELWKVPVLEVRTETLVVLLVPLTSLALAFLKEKVVICDVLKGSMKYHTRFAYELVNNETKYQKDSQFGQDQSLKCFQAGKSYDDGHQEFHF